jgi:tetratricopeptide (TPR) repeat protein
VLLALRLLLAADPTIAAIDEAWPRRDQPQESAAISALAESFASPQESDYEKLWRAARWYAWLAGAKIGNEEKQKLSKRGRELGERAEKANPKGIEAKYWTSINVGFYATTIPVFDALTLGIERHFRDPLIEVTKSSAEQRGNSVEYVGAEMALGSYYYKMPWPKQDKTKSREWFARALREHPENLRAHYLYGEMLGLDGKNADARKELMLVVDGNESYDPPDARRFKLYARELLATLK